MLIPTFMWSVLKILLWAELLVAAIYIHQVTPQPPWNTLAIVATAVALVYVIVREVAWAVHASHFRKVSAETQRQARESSVALETLQLPIAPSQPLTHARWRSTPIPGHAGASRIASRCQQLFYEAVAGLPTGQVETGRVDVLQSTGERHGAVLCHFELPCADIVYVIRACRDGFGEYILWTGCYTASTLGTWIERLFAHTGRSGVLIAFGWFLSWVCHWPIFVIGIAIAAVYLWVELPVEAGSSVYRNGIRSPNNSALLGPDLIEGGIANGSHSDIVQQVHSCFLSALQQAMSATPDRRRLAVRPGKSGSISVSPTAVATPGPRPSIVPTTRIRTR